jgi:hypothetical protein
VRSVRRATSADVGCAESSFPPCTDCDCELAAGNEADCVGNPHSVCGDCLWARGIIRFA